MSARAATTLVVLCFASRLAAAPPDSTPPERVPLELERLTDDGLLKQRPAWSPDGRRLVFARHEGDSIWLMLLSMVDRSQRRLTTRDAPEFDAVWSPDGARLALAIDKVSPNQGDIEVHTIRADGEDSRAVAVTQGKLSHEEWPSWSPDGKRLVFSSTRDDNQELYLVDATGGEWTRLTNDAGIDAHPCWSPDGASIVFATSRWGDLELAVIRPDGGGLTRLTESRGMDDYPVWSPDGQQLAWTSNRDGDFEIYVARADGSDPWNATRSPGIDNFPAWTLDGRLTFVSARDGGFDVYVQRTR